MNYAVAFHASSFPWEWPMLKNFYDMISEADKVDEFEKLLEDHYEGYSPTAAEIRDYVSCRQCDILASLGLDEDGRPLDGCKNYKVFFRLTGVVSEEVRAKDASEAVAKASEELVDRPGDPCIMIDQEDVEELIPVAYDDGDGITKDYPEEENRWAYQKRN